MTRPNNRQLSRSGLSILIIFLLMFSFAMIAIPAHAYTVNNTNHGSFQNVFSDGFAIKVNTIGDVLILAIQTDSGTTQHTAVKVSTITDNQTNTWTFVGKSQRTEVSQGSCSPIRCLDSELWFTSAASAGHDSFTVTLDNTQNVNNGEIEIIDVGSLAAAVTLITTDSCVSSCGTTAHTSASLTFNPASDLPAASLFTSCQSSFVLSAGSGYIVELPTSIFDGGLEYGNSASLPSSPTNFPWSCSGSIGTWYEVGAIFGTGFTTTNTTVVPPSIFSFNYWLYPILMLGLYDAFFLAEGLIAKVSTKGLTYLMIGGFVIGSIIALMMGMIEFELPILTLVGFFIYLFRIKN